MQITPYYNNARAGTKLFALTTTQEAVTSASPESPKTQNWQIIAKKTLICLVVCIFIRNFAADFV